MSLLLHLNYGLGLLALHMIATWTIVSLQTLEIVLGKLKIIIIILPFLIIICRHLLVLVASLLLLHHHPDLLRFCEFGGVLWQALVMDVEVAVRLYRSVLSVASGGWAATHVIIHIDSISITWILLVTSVLATVHNIVIWWAAGRYLVVPGHVFEDFGANILKLVHFPFFFYMFKMELKLMLLN